MGVPAYLVASSVVAIMGQRLVRLVCQKCKEPYNPPDALQEMAGIPPEMAANATFMRGKGCSACGGGGYRGRLAIFELMLMSSKLRELAFNEAPTSHIRRTAQTEGMKSLYQDGLEKVCRGITTLEELFRVAKPGEEA
jgi:type IV pilus assembly protein PilB